MTSSPPTHTAAPSAAPPTRTPRRSVTALLYLASGLLLGVAWLAPAMAPAAWLSIAGMVWAVARCRRLWGVFGGVWLMGGLGRWVGLPWLADMNRVGLGFDDVDARALVVVECAYSAWWAAAAAALVWLVAQRLNAPRWRDACLVLGLPVAWALGELGSFSTIHISADTWLTTQWTVEPVLRLLGRLGWHGTSLVCLTACAGVGMAAARRAWRWAGTVALAALMCALPPLPQVGSERLEGIGVMHITDALTAPHRLPEAADIDVLVWPEEARFERVALAEGGTPGAHVRPLVLDASDVVHLAGYLTQAPHTRTQNQLLEVRPDGVVGQSRAKRLLLPLGETPFLGFGPGNFAPGMRSPMMEVRGRRLIALICGEMLGRALVDEGVRDGGEVLIAAARDRITVGEHALRHMLAIQVLRSVEFGVPSARASLAGYAYFVASDGEVLAKSAIDRNGVLTWDRVHGARDFDFLGRPIDPSAPPPPAPEPTVAVLYAKEAPNFRTPCPEGRCTYRAIDDFACPANPTARAVIVAGHGKPPRWLAHPPEDIARAVRCFAPEVVVIDTCLGASGELLDALVDLGAVVVATTTLIPNAGLNYGAAFFEPGDPARRADAVSLPGTTLLRWRPTAEALNAARRWVQDADRAALRAHAARFTPPLVAAPLPSAQGAVLLPVEARRLGPPRRRPKRKRRPRRRPPQPKKPPKK